MTYGYCVYHEIDCDYAGQCVECIHNTEEDIEWFKQDEKRAESKLDGDPIDIDKAVEHYEGTLETLKDIDLEVDDG